MMNGVLIYAAFVVVGLIIFICVIFVSSRVRYSKITKRELKNNNKYIESNKEKLSKLFDEKYQELEPIKKRMICALVFLVVAIVSSFIINNKYYSIIAIGITGIWLIVFFLDYNSNSDKKFYEIAREIIKDFDNELDYQPSMGFTSAEYGFCRFPETCDRFHSEDMIVNKSKGFQFADVLVESEYEDDDGHTHYSTEYQGSLAKMSIKDVDCKIFLGGMKTNWLFSNKDYIKIKFENDEFNDLFRAYADNELIAYKILTPDVMEEFVNIKKYSFGDVDIRILNNKLYIRFLSGNGFDSSSFSKEMDKENLCQSIAVLEEVMKTMEKVKKIIERKNVD